MSIKILPDVGAPAAVGVVNIVMDKYAPTYKDWVTLGLTGVGYIVAGMNLVRGDMGDFIKNLAVASLPGTMNWAYNKVVVGGAGARVTGQRMALRPASQAIRQTTVPEMATVRIS